MKIVLLYPQPDALSPANWSGTPSGLARGLEACGTEVIPVGARLPFGVHQAVAVLSRIGGRRGAVADRMPVRQRARTWVLTRNLAQVAGTVDAVVAMGTEMYDLAAVSYPGVPVATYDDGTLREKLFPGSGPHLKASHPGAGFRAGQTARAEKPLRIGTTA